MKIGPITKFAARRPMSGQRGPSHVCTISTSTPSGPPAPPPTSTNLQLTFMPRVIPRTCRYRISLAGRSTVISATHQVGYLRKRPPNGRQADEDGVIAARDRRLLLALDLCHHAIQDSNSPLILAVAHAAESVRLGTGKRPRQRLLLRRQNVEDEVRPLLYRGVHVVAFLDGDEDEGRLE